MCIRDRRYRLGGRDVLLNLAKNPTGFNQNLKIVEADRGPKMVAFFINDQVADGRDISWIWDIDFEELADQPDTVVFAGGSRAHDLAVRLKYAGIAVSYTHLYSWHGITDFGRYPIVSGGCTYCEAGRTAGIGGCVPYSGSLFPGLWRI